MTSSKYNYNIHISETNEILVGKSAVIHVINEYSD